MTQTGEVKVKSQSSRYKVPSSIENRKLRPGVKTDDNSNHPFISNILTNLEQGYVF